MTLAQPSPAPHRHKRLPFGSLIPYRRGWLRKDVVDGETMPFVDVTAVAMLRELDETLERGGVQLVFARNVGVVRDVVRRASDGAAQTPLYPTVQEAVDAVRREPA